MKTYKKYLNEATAELGSIDTYDVEVNQNNKWSIMNKNVTLQQAKKLKKDYSDDNARIVKVTTTRKAMK
jgi:hypothetical protein